MSGLKAGTGWAGSDRSARSAPSALSCLALSNMLRIVTRDVQL